jgi:anti-sigma B factor antagonist
MAQPNSHANQPSPEGTSKPGPFRLDERRLDPGTIEMLIAGEVDLAVVSPLKAALNRARQRGDSVLVDLGACTFIDSSGLAVFVRANQELVAAGQGLRLHGCRGQVRQVLELTGLTEGGLVAGDRDAALQALRADAPV